MNKRFLLITIVFLTFVLTVKAEDINIKNNGANSSNSIEVKQDSSTTVKQGGSIEINNSITANASTGNNNVSGNSNGNSTIVTGNANTSVNVSNNGNNNTVNSKTTPSPTHATIMPTSTPGSSNTNTSDSNSSSNSNNSDTGSSSGSSDTNTGGIGGGEVRGLAATSGFDGLSVFSSIAGFICLVIGSALVSRREQSR